MFTVNEKVQNLRLCSRRYKLMIEIDKMVKQDKVFTLYELNTKATRNKTVQCDIISPNGEPIATFTSSTCSFGDALRNIIRQIKSYNSNTIGGGMKCRN